MSKIIVLSAPRSGTHMLVRMISRSLKLPWKVMASLSEVSKIKEDSWVIGVHETYEDALKFCDSQTKIICIKRINGHQQSLKNLQGQKSLI